MAIHIQSGKNNFNLNLKNCKVHSIPSKIHADCDAPVSSYFESNVKTGENNVLSASFRGYPLKGSKIEIPKGYVGFVLHESIKPCREKDERKFYVTNKFQEVTYWNWSKIPSKNDPFLKALDWIDIAEALHRPVFDE
ncbi:ribonuclease H2 subunit C [Euwallacea similis]|uniref:ribonuclease H2 subunit C n=1 Tax=Euwallacea similis TaxID=1736056 RepID=UPI0034502EED